MIRTGVVFSAGVAAGVYGVVKVRRVAEAFTPEGLRDRLAGLGVGAHLFADEVRTGMGERETELRQRLGLGLHGLPELALPEGPEGSRRPLALAPEPPGDAPAPTLTQTTEGTY